MSELLADDGHLFHVKKGKSRIVPVEVPAPLAPLADTHGHLTAFRQLNAATAVARAALAGLRLLVVPVDPADDVPDAPAFLGWFEQVREDAAELLDQVALQGAVPPTFGLDASLGEHAAQSWGHAQLGNGVRGAASAELDIYKDVPALVDNIHFVVGVHPYGAQRYLDDAGVRERIARLAGDRRCVGIGEFGLDYGPWNEVDPKVQETAFREQLRLAHELGLPVELHLRDAQDDSRALAHADALRVLVEEGVPEAGCDLHCFTSGPDVMRPFCELGCHIAFGGAATFARSDEIRAAAALCPPELMLSETDSPYMAPVPLRGQECEPAMIAFTAARLADLRTDAGSAATTYAQLWRNANSFFGLDG